MTPNYEKCIMPTSSLQGQWIRMQRKYDKACARCWSRFYYTRNKRKQLCNEANRAWSMLNAFFYQHFFDQVTNDPIGRIEQ